MFTHLIRFCKRTPFMANSIALQTECIVIRSDSDFIHLKEGDMTYRRASLKLT